MSLSSFLSYFLTFSLSLSLSLSVSFSFSLSLSHLSFTSSLVLYLYLWMCLSLSPLSLCTSISPSPLLPSPRFEIAEYITWRPWDATQCERKCSKVRLCLEVWYEAVDNEAYAIRCHNHCLRNTSEIQQCGISSVFYITIASAPFSGIIGVLE